MLLGIHYALLPVICCVLQEKKEEIQRRNDLENKIDEILENLKTRLLVE